MLMDLIKLAVACAIVLPLYYIACCKIFKFIFSLFYTKNDKQRLKTLGEI